MTLRKTFLLICDTFCQYLRLQHESCRRWSFHFYHIILYFALLSSATGNYSVMVIPWVVIIFSAKYDSNKRGADICGRAKAAIITAFRYWGVRDKIPEGEFTFPALEDLQRESIRRLDSKQKFEEYLSRLCQRCLGIDINSIYQIY